MRNRVIIVPKDKQAETDLDYDLVEKTRLIELALTDGEFNFLFENGIIELINKEVCVNIDDGEDEYVKGSENLKIVLNALELETHDIKKLPLMKKLLNLFEEALEKDTGVYFYF